VLDEFGKVDCNWGGVGMGMKSAPYAGSPLYVQTFSGVGADGLHGFPLGWLSDNAESRNMFFGLFSFLGEDSSKELIKLAEKGSNIVEDMLETLESSENDEEFDEVMEKVESFLDEYRDKYDEERTDSGYLNQLARKWFGPRQTER